jgi:DNA polymerase I
MPQSVKKVQVPFGFAPEVAHCTMLLSQVLHTGEKLGHKLGDCVNRELMRTLDKTEQKSDWSGNLTPAQLTYAAEDAAVLVPLHDALAIKLNSAGLTEAVAIESRCLPAVAWVSSSGVGFDGSAWEALAAESMAEADSLRAELDAAAPTDPERMFQDMNWDSPEQVQRIFVLAGITIADTSDETLAALDHPLAGLLRRYRAVQKRATTYGTDWLKHVAADGRIYASWVQLGAGSGRMACRAPNLQNLPRDPRYRKCFTAPPGRMLVKADYSQIELRIAAKISNDKDMLAAYHQGADLHTLTAQKVLGIQSVTKEQRQLAKALNFGLLYGMGAKGFRVYARTQYGVNLTEEEAAGYRTAFFRTYRGLAKWHRSMPKLATDTRTLVGRRRKHVERFTEKLNVPVQGTGADGLKRALALLWERRGECPGAFPVLVVHDEIVVEAAADQADVAAAWLRQAMLDGFGTWLDPVPIVVEVSTAKTWGG